MNLLAIDTATEACSAAVWKDGALHSRFELVGRDHTQRLLQVVAAVMADAGLRYGDLHGIACGVGPGSFAGVRIAVAFCKGLALAHETPVVGVSSLALLAQGQLRRKPSAQHIAAAIDARMGEVYCGLFANQNGLAVAVGPEQVAAPMSVKAWVEAVPSFDAVGSGWPAYTEALSQALGQPQNVLANSYPDALDALALARPIFESGGGFAADALAPTYLRNNVALTLVQQQAAKTSL